MAFITMNNNRIDFEESRIVLLLSRLWPAVTPVEVIRLCDGIRAASLVTSFILLLVLTLFRVAFLPTLISCTVVFFLLALGAYFGMVLPVFSKVSGYIAPVIYPVFLLYVAGLAIVAFLMKDFKLIHYLVVLVALLLYEQIEYLLRNRVAMKFFQETGKLIPPNEMAFIVAFTYYARLYGFDDSLETEDIEVSKESIEAVKNVLIKERLSK